MNYQDLHMWQSIFFFFPCFWVVIGLVAAPVTNNGSWSSMRKGGLLLRLILALVIEESLRNMVLLALAFYSHFCNGTSLVAGIVFLHITVLLRYEDPVWYKILKQNFQII